MSEGSGFAAVSSFHTRLRTELLPRVTRPHRYLGSEWNATPPRGGVPRIALVLPDVYETSERWIPPKILYGAINRRSDAVAERFHSSDADLSSLLAARGLPAFSAETGTPLGGFDLAVFFLPSWTVFTNTLDLLHYGGIPLLAVDRSEHDPLVIAIGPDPLSPEPIAPFVDAFAMGDPEMFEDDLVGLARDRRLQRGPRDELLHRAAVRTGFYVPELFKGGHAVRGGVICPVVRRELPDLESAFWPDAPPVPFGEGAGDRYVVEVARAPVPGSNGQARGRSKASILRAAVEGLRHTGYGDLSLIYPTDRPPGELPETLADLAFLLRREAVRVLLPGPIASPPSSEILRCSAAAGRASFALTFLPISTRSWPGGGGLSSEEVFTSCEGAFALGIDSIRLHVTVGAPGSPNTERIFTLLDELRLLGKRIRGKPVQIAIVGSPFVPVPHTPWQWSPSLSRADIAGTLVELKKRAKTSVRTFAPESALLDVVFARGDRSLAPVIRRAWELGARFDGHVDRFSWSLWEQAFRENGKDGDDLMTKGIAADASLPWRHLESNGEDERLRQALREASEPAPVSYPSGVQIRKHVESGSDGRTSPSHPPATHNVRLRYEKIGDMRFLGHLDLMAEFLRALRRASLPLGYTGGDSPHPRVAFGPPLPLFYEGTSEWCDVGLALPTPPELLSSQLNRVLPAGLRVLGARYLPARVDSLTAAIAWADYRVVWPGASVPEIDHALARFAAASEMIVSHETKAREKQLDLKRMVPHAERIAVDPPTIEFRLSASGGGVRLSEVLRGIFSASSEVLVGMLCTRTAQYVQRGKEILEP